MPKAAKPTTKPAAAPAKIAAAVGTAVTTGNPKAPGMSNRIEQAMAAAGEKAMSEGKSDDDVRAAKLAARERVKKDIEAENAKAAEDLRRSEQFDNRRR